MRPKYVSIEVASARGVAERWRSQYQNRKDGWLDKIAGGSPKKIYDQLCELGESPSLDKVAEIIGNKSWSYITCTGCNAYVERAVRLGTDYNDGPQVYCTECIQEAHQILIGDQK